MEITAFAPPAEAHARIAFALTEVRKYLIPDSNDEIRQEQMRELEMISVNGDSVLDSLKQQSQAALLLGGAGCLPGLLQGVGGLQSTSSNAFMASSFQPPASASGPGSSMLVSSLETSSDR